MKRKNNCIDMWKNQSSNVTLKTKLPFTYMGY